MTFSFNEVKDLLLGRDDDWLYTTAHQKKQEIYGNQVFIRGIIENSNVCARNCAYCGIRAGNKGLIRYDLDVDTIMTAVHDIDASGIKSIVIQSGEADNVSDAKMIEIITKIKASTGADITLSLGEKSYETYRAFRDAGADRYLLKIETFNQDLYDALHPGYSLQNRINCTNYLLDLGYQVGSGFIWGLPGQTVDILAQDILTLQQLGVHMYSTTPFVQAKGSLLENHPNGDVETVYRSMALYRLLAPTVNIPVASACASLDNKSKEHGLMRGANVLMLSYTPASVRNNYALYQGKNTVLNERISDLENLKNLTQSIGQELSFTFGRSLYERKKA